MIRMKWIYSVLIIVALSICLLSLNIISSNNDKEQLIKIVGYNSTIECVDGSWPNPRTYLVGGKLYYEA